MTQKDMERFAPLSKEGSDLLEKAMNSLSLSARAYTRIIKVSRTIADLGGEENVLPRHLAEAVQYRSLDRENI
jgi:magnesium chelatase family protein